MPSQKQVPSVEALRSAFRTGVLSEGDPNADLRTGSIYDLFGGVGAMVFRRLALRDRDIFRATYFDFSEGAALAKIVEQRFGSPLDLGLRGEGVATLSRPSPASGAGTVWAGTRITVMPERVGESKTYYASEDVRVGLETDARVPVVAEFAGAGVAIDSADLSPARVRIEDPLWDATWKVARIVCSDGRARETDEAARARIRQALAQNRFGYAETIFATCVAAGAAKVALFASDFLSSSTATGIEHVGEIDEDGYGDVGLNNIFVADASFTTSTALLNACRMAVDGAAMNGMAVQVFGMAPAPVTVRATVRLWTDPGRFGIAEKENGVRSAVLNHFETRKNPFYFRKAAIRGDILRAVKDIHSVDVTTSYLAGGAEVTADPTLPGVLRTAPIRRFLALPETVLVTVMGP